MHLYILKFKCNNVYLSPPAPLFCKTQIHSPGLEARCLGVLQPLRTHRTWTPFPCRQLFLEELHGRHVCTTIWSAGVSLPPDDCHSHFFYSPGEFFPENYSCSFHFRTRRDSRGLTNRDCFYVARPKTPKQAYFTLYQYVKV